MTRKLKKILVAVDETPSSITAIEQGLALASEEGAHVVFVHVVPIVGEKLIPGRARLQRVLDLRRTRVLADSASAAKTVGVPCSTELLAGHPPKQIMLLADELDVDVVLVGSQYLSTSTVPTREHVTRTHQWAC
jgi:nucleotide-binding universal stress UspA family protein